MPTQGAKMIRIRKPGADGAKASPPIIPPDRLTLFQPGVTYNGGLPNRSTVSATLSPLGSGQDDTAQINAAIAAAPDGTIVQLTAGTFNIGTPATSASNNRIVVQRSNITLRGVGASPVNGAAAAGGNFTDTGTLAGGTGGTILLKGDRATNTLFGVFEIGNDCTLFSGSRNLTADTVLNSYTCQVPNTTGLAVGMTVLIDHNTDSDPNVYWSSAFGPPGDGSRQWFTRQDRSVNQIMEIAAINGLALTFKTPFHYAFKTAFTAQLSIYAQPVLTGLGFEDFCVMGGMGGDFHGNLSMYLCTYSWIKRVEAYWSAGTNIGLYGCYRCEVRDSFMHGTPDPNPGGGGYQSGMSYGCSDCLFENNIMWYGNKQIVMRATGGGNVVAYNYMDDSFGSGYPELGEAGLNAAHYTTPHMELLEGNYSQNFKGDSFWGNSIYITVFRNWLTTRRAAHAPLDTYSYNPGGGTIYPYFDGEIRRAVDIQAYSLYNNIVGNVLGQQGQALLSYNANGYVVAQTGFVFERTASPDPANGVFMFYIGEQQNPGGSTWVASTYQTLLMDGNWDWVTASQTWLGIGGTQASPLGTPRSIPNSLYLAAKPSFFGANTWPWVDPSTGTTHTLPAKLRFDNGTPNTVA